MKMPFPGHTDHTDHTVVTSRDGNDRDNTNGEIDVSRRKSDNNNLDSFHRLQLERLENQRKTEQQWRRRKCSRIGLRCYNSNLNSQSPSGIDGSPSIIDTRDLSARGSAIAGKTDEDISILSARRELLRLGRRYAISQRRSTTLIGRDDHRFESHAPIQNPIEGVALTDPTCLLNSKSMSSAALVPICLHRDANTSVIAHDEIDASTAAIFGCSHYLLLARTNSQLISKVDNESKIFDDDDGSSFESYNTPAPHLQAASTCNSPGENKDGDGDHSYVEEHDRGILNQCSSVGGAQTSGFEVKDPQETHPASVTRSDTLLKDALGQLDKKIFRNKTFLILIAITAIFVCWRTTWSWYNLNYTRLHPIEFRSGLHVKISCAIKSIKAVLYSKLSNASKHFFIRDLFTRFTMWPRLGWDSVIDRYKNWRKDFDLLSCVIHHIYRLQIMNQEMKHSFWAVRDTLVVAWNTTLSVVISFSQHLKNEHWSNTSHPFVQQDLNIMNSASPFYSELALGNQTQAKLVVQSPSPKFWRSPFGPLFTRQQLPLTRHRYIHSIPSLGIGQEASFIPISPPFSEFREPNTHGRSQPIFLRKRPCLSLDKIRLDSVSILLNFHQNTVASALMQKSRPPRHSEYLPRQPFQAVTSAKRNYYQSSYPTGHHEKDVFEDVDVMKLFNEFLSRLLNRRKQRVDSLTFEDNLPQF
jgi:hypothetical protein